jgi:hypothetical protein
MSREKIWIIIGDPEGKMGYHYGMETTRTRKKPGPVRRLAAMRDTHIHLPEDLLDWAKSQPEGLAPLVRDLLIAERERRQAREG